MALFDKKAVVDAELALLRYPAIPLTPTPNLFVTFSDVRKDFAAVAEETSIERQARLLNGSDLNREHNLLNHDEHRSGLAKDDNTKNVRKVQ